MADFESTGVEVSEVAEPTEETGVEEPEVAEQVSEPEEQSGKTDADARFAEMRRAQEAAEREAAEARAELAELQAQTEARSSAFARLTGRDEDAEIAALAEITGMSEDEIRAEMEAAEESAQKDLEIQHLREQVDSIEADRMMQEDLNELRKIDPSLKSLDELGDQYIEYIAAGLPPERAYWAVKAEQRANQATPPKEIGAVATGSAEKDYFTDAEIDAMSPDQLTKNYKKILASWERRNS